jgi:hypothetical protein
MALSIIIKVFVYGFPGLLVVVGLVENVDPFLAPGSGNWLIVSGLVVWIVEAILAARGIRV